MAPDQVPEQRGGLRTVPVAPENGVDAVRARHRLEKRRVGLHSKERREQLLVVHLEATIDERASGRVPAPGEVASHRHVVQHLARRVVLQDERRGAFRVKAGRQSAPEAANRPARA